MSIISEIFKKPIITFGLNQLKKDASVNEPVRVWVTSIHNSKAVGIAGKPSANLKITKVSNYEFSIEYNAPGTYEFFVISSRKYEAGGNTKTITRESNRLTINVT